MAKLSAAERKRIYERARRAMQDPETPPWALALCARIRAACRDRGGRWNSPTRPRTPFVELMLFRPTEKIVSATNSGYWWGVPERDEPVAFCGMRVVESGARPERLLQRLIALDLMILMAGEADER